MSECLDCGHEGCDGRECKGEFLYTAPGGRLLHDCAICCREIIAGERVGELREIARVFRVLAALAA